VVYGVTAIAAALSDLRIVVQVDTLPDPHIEVHLPDAYPEDTTGTVVTYEKLVDILPHRTEPLTPIVPSEAVIEKLRNLFDGKPESLAQGVMAVSFLTANILPECLWGEDESRRGIKVQVKSAGLPIGAGLGSSASFAVALSAALLRLRQLMYCDIFPQGFPVEEIAGDDTPEGWQPPGVVLNMLNGWAYAAEVVIHGEPSGLDNTTSCFGGAVRLNRTLGRFETLPPLPEMNILLTNTHVPRTTKTLVRGVRVLHDAMPAVVKPILESVEGVSQEFLRLIDPSGSSTATAETTSTPPVASPAGTPSKSTPHVPKKPDSLDEFIDAVGQLMNVNQGLLCALGVGHPALNRVVEASAKHGNMASKLTGAGGGGCAITLVSNEEHLDELRDALCDLGYDTFMSKVGGVGVKWHGQHPNPPPMDMVRIGRVKPDETNTTQAPSDTVVERQPRSESVVKESTPPAPSLGLYTLANILSGTVTVGAMAVLFGKVETVVLALVACLLGYACSKLACALLSSGGNKKEKRN